MDQSYSAGTIYIHMFYVVTGIYISIYMFYVVLICLDLFITID